MTEPEAKTKWCHRVIRDPRDGDSIGPGQCCIASACMAWRAQPRADVQQAKAELAADRKINAIKALRAAYPSYGLLEAKEVIEGARPWPTEEPNGYCGLAGAPQP